MNTDPRIWRPERPLEIVAGTAPGGGLDRTARALALAIDASRQVDVPVIVKNIPGDGARRAWAYMDERARDPHCVSISHPNLTTDRLMGLAAFDHRSYTPIAMLYTEYIAFAVRSDSELRTAPELLEHMRRDSSSLRIALSTALGNPNHIAVARVLQHVGADPKAPTIHVFDSALDAVADVASGNAHVAAVTAASTFAALAAHEVRVIAVSAPVRIGGELAAVPTWKEQSVDCAIGAWRGVAGAAGLDAEHVAFWQATSRAAVQTQAWRTALVRHGWSASYMDGAALAAALEEEKAEMARMLDRLGLIAFRPS